MAALAGPVSLVISDLLYLGQDKPVPEGPAPAKVLAGCVNQLFFRPLLARPIASSHGLPP